MGHPAKAGLACWLVGYYLAKNVMESFNSRTVWLVALACNIELLVVEIFQ